MHNYTETKKVRRIAAVIYIIVVLFIVGGSYLAQQQKEKGALADALTNPYEVFADSVSAKSSE